MFGDVENAVIHHQADLVGETQRGFVLPIHGPGTFKKNRFHRTGKPVSPKRSQNHATPRAPWSLLRLAFPFSQTSSSSGLLCAALLTVTCYPSRHGKEAQNWTTKQGDKAHVEVHPLGLWKTRSFRPISTRIRPCFPRSPNSWNDFYTPDTPNLDEVLSSQVPRRGQTPTAAQVAWARCFLAALSGVTSHDETRVWTDLLCLPKLVLRLRRVARRSQRVPLAEATTLPEPEPDDHAKDPHDEVSDFQGRDDRSAIPAKESQLSKACSALPPARKSRQGDVGPSSATSGRGRGQMEASPGCLNPPRSPWSRKPSIPLRRGSTLGAPPTTHQLGLPPEVRRRVGAIL